MWHPPPVFSPSSYKLLFPVLAGGVSSGPPLFYVSIFRHTTDTGGLTLIAYSAIRAAPMIALREFVSEQQIVSVRKRMMQDCHHQLQNIVKIALCILKRHDSLKQSNTICDSIWVGCLHFFMPASGWYNWWRLSDLRVKELNFLFLDLPQNNYPRKSSWVINLL